MSAAEERIGVGALHHDLRNDVQFGRFDGNDTRLLRIEQVLPNDLGFINTSVVTFPLRLLLPFDLLCPEAIERREFAAAVTHEVHPIIEFQRRTDRLSLECRPPQIS